MQRGRQRTEREYHYREAVQRQGVWMDGYSANDVAGRALWPVRTKTECREESRLDGTRAVFFRDGNRESGR